MLARSKLLKGNEPNEVLMFVPFFLKETKTEKKQNKKTLLMGPWIPSIY